MTLFDAFRFDGKRALVVGGATGMGAAVAELAKDAGADVVVMDRAAVTLEGVKTIALDLSDKDSIDAAVDDAAVRCTRCSPAPESPTARRASSASTSSGTGG